MQEIENKLEYKIGSTMEYVIFKELIGNISGASLDEIGGNLDLKDSLIYDKD